MNRGNMIGAAASLGSVLVAVVVLNNTDNSRMAQGAVLFELVAIAMLICAGIQGAQRWFLVRD